MNQQITGTQLPLDAGKQKAPLRWMPFASALLSAVACYGTLALITALSFLGVSLAVNVGVWAAAIVALSALAAVGVSVSAIRRRNYVLFFAAVMGALLISWAMYGQHNIETLIGVPSAVVEIAGFVCLIGASIWKGRCT